MQYKATIGADFLTKQLTRQNASINLQIWDTVGSERYHAMGSSFYRNSEACVLVFDLTSEVSFNNVETWRKEFLTSLNPPEGDKFPFVLFANKSDLETDIKVSDDNIKAYCLEHNDMPYFKVSAKNGNSVEEGFDKVCDLAFNRAGKKEDILLPDIKAVKVQPPTEKKGGCLC